MKTQHIAIYGAGGFAREVAWLLESCKGAGESLEIVGFIDDNPALQNTVVNEIPVRRLADIQRMFPDSAVAVAIAAPSVRQKIVETVSALGLSFATIVHPRVERSRWVEVGAGSIICAGAILTTNVVLGRHVHVNPACTIGHDVRMGDCVTLTPGVHVAGWVHIGNRVFVGTGSSIINGTAESPLIIGDDVVIGAGACVTRSVPAGITVVGVPAKPIVKH